MGSEERWWANLHRKIFGDGPFELFDGLFGDQPWRRLHLLEKVLVVIILAAPLLLLIGRWGILRVLPWRLLLFLWIVSAWTSLGHWCARAFRLPVALVGNLTLVLSFLLFAFPYFGAVGADQPLGPALAGLAAALLLAILVGFVWRALVRRLRGS